MAVLTITPASVKKSSSGQVSVKRIATGVTVTQGQALYQLANTDVGLADANGTSPANTFLGFALTAGASEQPVVVLTGDAGGYAVGATLAIGPIYLSDTPGAVTQTLGDLASGSALIQIGAALTTTTANITPVVGGTTTA